MSENGNLNNSASTSRIYVLGASLAAFLLLQQWQSQRATEDRVEAIEARLNTRIDAIEMRQREDMHAISGRLDVVRDKTAELYRTIVDRMQRREGE